MFVDVLRILRMFPLVVSLELYVSQHIRARQEEKKVNKTNKQNNFEDSNDLMSTIKSNKRRNTTGKWLNFKRMKLPGGNGGGI